LRTYLADKRCIERAHPLERETMTMVETAPIACTLRLGELRERLAWIGTLNRDALRSYERRDLALDLCYAPGAVDRIREMVRNEAACCSFLTFDMREGRDEIQLTITAPEAAREAADALFEQFVAGAPSPPNGGSTGASTLSEAMPPSAGIQTAAKAASFTAVTLATGAVACGACCVLPFALPAAALASAGSVLAWLAGAYAWITGVALLAVLGAWAWIAWDTARSQRRPAASTLYVMTAATILTAVAALWP
jgi:hypothetical protein